MILTGETNAYIKSKKEYTPMYILDTAEKSLKKFNEDTEEYEEVVFTLFTDEETGEEYSCHLKDCKHACKHVDYSVDYYPKRLQEYLDNGTLVDYLIHKEKAVSQTIDRQVEKWKESDKEYQTAKLLGDIQKQAQLENGLIFMAKEAVYPAMVYI